MFPMTAETYEHTLCVIEDLTLKGFELEHGSDTLDDECATALAVAHLALALLGSLETLLDTGTFRDTLGWSNAASLAAQVRDLLNGPE